MATNQLGRVIQTLRRAAGPHDEAAPTDGQLLESYVRGREEAAFAALVRRHGPMVWGVCRRLLRSHQDAEDAFQATFLVLVRKASSVVPRELVANWLYGVAHQTALKARATTARRGARERQVTAMPEPARQQQDLWDQLQSVLDQELSRLPDKYSAVIALCDLEGKTRKEAARQLNVPEGTVASRHATARAMLARRLARSGVALSGAALAALLAQNAAPAGVPASVTLSTIKAASMLAAGRAAAPGVISAKAVALAEGVLKAMLLSKPKTATAVLVMMAVFATGGAALTHSVLADKPVAEKQPPAEKPAEKKVPPAPAAAAKKEADALPRVVSGVVKAVDVGKGALTVTHQGGEDTFNIAKEARVEIDGKPGELAAIPAGASVSLRQFVDAKTAGSVRAEGRWLWGVVAAVDAANGTISFGDRAQESAAGKTFTVPKDLAVSIDGKPGQLSGVPGGASVNLQLCADQTTVRSLSAEGAQVNGLVKAVDAGKNTITVGDTAYPVAEGAGVVIDRKPGRLADLPEGANVTLNLRVDQKTVLRISAGGASVFGTVKAVDVAKNTITVTGHPDDRTFSVAADTVITIDGQPGAVTAIPPGSGVHALNLRVDQQTTDSINVVGPSFHHVPVSAVDAEKNTITIGEPAPAEVAGKTLAVAPDANVQIDGKPGRLDGIPAGAFVNLGLSVDSQTARVLQAEGPNLGECGGSPVSAVDVMNNTITFDEKATPAVAGKTFTLVKDAWITIDGKPGTLADLPTGSYVNVTLTVDQQKVRSLGAHGPQASGALKAVDAAKGTITVDDTSYVVAKDALVVIDGRSVRLADLATGVEVNINLRVDQKTVGMIQTKAP